ncbi:Pentatricopeptide repeat-containing protein [Artemisia annua]|uniref:Pentatricopeptide repeat-containing protein n=1 Tax=Artemisia annua TaxID=35608 RepID=A0A2U1P8M5_ARTAN|nr:Pentatricopeptide repeat-containing protein [Artemisia annua]
MTELSVALDIRSYNARLVGLVAKKKVNEAVEVFGELRVENIMPDVFTCVRL